MSLASLLTHPLAVVPQTGQDQTSLDEYGHIPEADGAPVLVSGLVQPKTASEVALSQQGGAPISTHVVFLLPRVLPTEGYIRDEPDTGRRLQITGVRSYEFGSQPHLEVDCRLIGAPEGPSVPGS